jgi:hypothetical protein
MNEGFIADRPEFEWLTGHASGWQFGEQGILVAISDAIGVIEGQCIEIGAGDGETLPLTIDPFYQRGNPCVLYELDPESLGRLMVKYPKAKLRGEFVPLVAKTTNGIDDSPLVCVVDVDGIDSKVMISMLTMHTPSVLMVEHFDKCHPGDTNKSQRIPEWLLGEMLHPNFTVQDNAETLKSIAIDFSYTRLGTTRVNSIFVHDSLVEKVNDYVPG